MKRATGRFSGSESLPHTTVVVTSLLLHGINAALQCDPQRLQDYLLMGVSDCNKCETLETDTGARRKNMCERADIWNLSLTAAQFYYELKLF